MIYKAGDVLLCKPLQEVSEFRSNVKEAYRIVVVSDDENELVTKMEDGTGEVRTFIKYNPVWKFGHSKRFEKV